MASEFKSGTFLFFSTMILQGEKGVNLPQRFMPILKQEIPT